MLYPLSYWGVFIFRRDTPEKAEYSRLLRRRLLYPFQDNAQWTQRHKAAR